MPMNNETSRTTRLSSISSIYLNGTICKYLPKPAVIQLFLMHKLQIISLLYEKSCFVWVFFVFSSYYTFAGLNESLDFSLVFACRVT